MGPIAESEMDAWLRGGGLVVTASDRAARALAAAFHRARQAEGLSAWPAPRILDWRSFVRAEWEQRSKSGADGRLLLNPTQEQALWTDIAARDGHLATLLEGPRHRLAAMAIRAHDLLAAYAPRYLRTAARTGWQQDAAAFSGWLTVFDETCRNAGLLSPSRLPLELIPLLEADSTARPPLLTAAFDRILPVQSAVFEAWGEWRQAADGEPAQQIAFYEAPDAQAELAACALWCKRRLAANPQARLLIVTQEAAARRGEIERALLKHASSAASPLFEFSLGIPLSQAPLPSGAYLLLRWLAGPLQEAELDWLLSTGQIAASPQEATALQAYMRELRRCGLERTNWTLDAFLSQKPAGEWLPAAWVQRISEARRRLDAPARRRQSPIDWASLVPHLLESAGWPGSRPLSSAEFQAVDRWQEALDVCGSLGFDGRRMRWQEFLSAVDRTLEQTLFAPQSRVRPIQVAGPVESAGLTADAVWFLGADEDAWPPGGATHPLLPLEVQREAGMPHASSQSDWDLASATTTRLLSSAPEVHFSYARQNARSEARPSRLVTQFAAAPQPLPPELLEPPSRNPAAVPFEDLSRIPFPPGTVAGGAGVLTAQSQCPFKAFATARLAAQDWNPAEAGLTARQRGQLLHAVLHAVWGEPPDSFSNHDELLQNAADRSSLVAGLVQKVLSREISPALRERMPRRYLEIEGKRLTKLVTEWLDFESARHPFTVLETELDSAVTIAGITLKLRLDRVDRLNDDSLLVIDYKSGDVTPSAWNLPRPDDVQLPLYAGFAMDPNEALAGLVFARVRPGELSFQGYVGDAAATLFPGLKTGSNLVRKPFGAEQLMEWREYIEQLAKDFLAGRADVDPRDYPKTCERCGLQTLCRIEENPARLEAEGESGDEEADDE
jgi:probable DNA repair protein